VLFIVSVLKAYGEILVMCMAGRGLLRLIMRQRADASIAYRIFAGMTRPWFQLARWIAPTRIADRHIGYFAAFLAVCFWVAASTQKIELCQGEAAYEQACRELRHVPRR